MLELSKIRIDGGTQSRVELNQGVVDEYAVLYREGVQMPPVKVFFDGSTFWLADGFHRFFGAKQAGRENIHEERIPGTQREAVLFSLGANAKHGLRRSNADKRKAVQTLLDDPEWAAWSSREVAKQCGVSHTFVDGVRESSLATLPVTTPADRTYATKHGTTATMSTGNIGRQSASNGTCVDPLPPPAMAHIGAKPAPSTARVSPPIAESKPTVIEGPVQRITGTGEDESSMRKEMLDDALSALSEENERLKNQLSAMLFTGDDEEKSELLNRLNELTERNKQLEILNRGLVQSRDRTMTENASLRKQCEINARKLKKVA